MKLIKRYFSIALLFLLIACNSQVKNNIDADTTEVQSTATAESVPEIMMKEVVLVNRNTKTGEKVSDDLLGGLQHAFDNRERTHVKLMPLFEYEVKFTNDGDEEVWRVNKAGYLMKNGSSELYKMDTSVLHDYMK